MWIFFGFCVGEKQRDQFCILERPGFIDHITSLWNLFLFSFYDFFPLLSSVSALVPLMKHKWGMIGFWRAAKRTAEASGVGRSSRLPPPPGKVENSCADPWGKSREGGLLWETMHLREAGRGLAGRGECVCRTGGGSACVCASVFVCVHGSALYVSWGKRGFDPLPPSSLLSATNKQTNNNMEPESCTSKTNDRH